MSTQTSEHSALNPFKLLGGLLSDTIEATKWAGNELMDIPSALAEGWQEGAIIDTDEEAPAQKNCTQTAEQVLLAKQAEELAAMKAELAELKALKEG